MPVEELRYDKMVEEALRGVVRDALDFAALHGLPGDHHFYVTFRTHFPGLALPDHLKARHPDEMTIVLQHQFWDLAVEDELFSVTLSFSGKPERMVIPFAAVTGFADPSAKFGLQFQSVPFEDEDQDMMEEEGDGPALTASSSQDRPADGAKDGPDGDGDGSGGGGKVVALDHFRKK